MNTKAKVVDTDDSPFIDGDTVQSTVPGTEPPVIDMNDDVPPAERNALFNALQIEHEPDSTELVIPLESINAQALFKQPGTMEFLLAEIEKQALDFEPDLTTDEGRAEIKSRAYNVSRSKTTIDKAGKALTEDLVAEKKKVDASRKKARDFCDALRDRIREPVTLWEEEQAKEAERAALAAKIAADEIAAHQENDLRDREAKMLAWEEEQERLRLEAERQEREEKEERERKDREEKIRQQAAKQAAEEAQKRIDDANEKAEKEKQERERLEEEARQKAIDDAREQERERQRIERETEERIRKEQEEKERIEREEKEKENRKKLWKRNVERIHGQTVTALIQYTGLVEKDAIQLVNLIAEGKIANLKINY